MPEKSLLEGRDEYLVNVCLMNPIMQAGGHFWVWCTKHQCGQGKPSLEGFRDTAFYLTLFMFNQLKEKFTLPSDDATSKSQSTIFLSTLIWFCQRSNSKKWITLIT